MLKKEMSIARQAAEEGGEILKSKFGRVAEITMKGEIDLVTEADLLSEKVILKIIGDNFPRDSILTEETGEYNHDPRRKWIIDPLDGTINFAHSYPFFAVSIALEIEQEVVLGVVLDPHAGEFFEAEKGRGAYLNGRPIKVSHTAEMIGSLLATGFSYDIHQNPDRTLMLFQRMVVAAQGVRRPGSAAIDLCYVAAGRVDGFWEEGLKPWDTAAGCLIVREAGGRVTNYQGEPFTPYQKNVAAANPFIHNAMVSLLRGER